MLNILPPASREEQPKTFKKKNLSQRQQFKL